MTNGTSIALPVHCRKGLVKFYRKLVCAAPLHILTQGDTEYKEIRNLFDTQIERGATFVLLPIVNPSVVTCCYIISVVEVVRDKHNAYTG